MSWFGLGAPTTKKECKKPCCENKQGHSHGGQQQQQQIPPQIQQALAQGFTPMQPITIMRNALGKEFGGSGVDIDFEKYNNSVTFWSEHVAIK